MRWLRHAPVPKGDALAVIHRKQLFVQDPGRGGEGLISDAGLKLGNISARRIIPEHHTSPKCASAPKGEFRERLAGLH